jgi:hypothetical protein
MCDAVDEFLKQVAEPALRRAAVPHAVLSGYHASRVIAGARLGMGSE